MSLIVHDVPQRSAEWHALRLGLLTGSAAAALLAERKRGSGELKDRVNLRRRLVAERVTGRSCDYTFVTADMERGIALESDAFAAYEAATGLIAEPVGFVSHATLRTGCSPDGRIGDWHGALELKCPRSTTHLVYLQAGVLPEEYRAQCLHTLWLTGAQWIDFCSFDPRFPEPLSFFRVRLDRKPDEMAAYELLVTQFLNEVQAEVDALVESLKDVA